MDAYIIDACRTPRGRRGGGLAGVHPIDLCTLPMKAIVARSARALDGPDTLNPAHVVRVHVAGPVGGTDLLSEALLDQL